MTISFASAVGNLVNRWGKIGLLAKQLRTYQAAQYTNLVDTAAGLVAQYNAEADLQAIVGSGYLGVLSGAGSGLGSLVQQEAIATANRMVFRDNPQFNQTLEQGDYVTSLFEIIRQAKQQGATVLAQTVTATPALFTANGGNGDGVLVASTRRPLDGLVLECMYAETLTAKCTADSYIGNATAGNESIQVTGVGSQPDPFAFNWPLGSNCRANLTAIDGSQSAAGGNLLTNSDWEDWTLGVPDNWSVIAGDTGDIAQEGSIVYSGSSALRFTGDGSTFQGLQQRFNSTAGTTGTFSPLSQYSFAVWMRRGGTPVSAGRQLVVELVDGNGTVLQDEAGNSQTFTFDLSALTVNYTALTGAFRTPLILPSQLNINVRCAGTALPAGQTVYLDRAGLGLMTQLYRSGPFLSCHSGASNFATGDYAYCTVTNGRGAAGTLDTFQTLLSRIYPLWMDSELLFPSSAAPSIPDSLIG